ncbi:uncharacterized protein LOC111716443 isoform X2 [Eurytemora carolleeae]|uniref:uncharacterized protein LOC111716443 isoform X2 n=1 Tax=Eurytemora carolleeae TaxID=1294199 RepID=UPI000C78024E|nr:uncharacterized protein LOC111716443 isoform X2 [Eurytemora carolleeae]|eukprot:XP_023347667.1 uncharacterized protein LOC111716443 isoform X2 [Eurytemora affinis]
MLMKFHQIRGVLSVLGGFLLMLTAGSFCGTIGNMAPYFASYMKQNNSEITNEDLGIVLAAGGMTQGFGSLLAGNVIIPWLGYRVSLVIGVILYCLAPLLSYFTIAYSLPAFTFTYGVLSAVVFYLIVLPSQLIPVTWFPDRKGLVTGIIAAGFGFGAAVFSPLQTFIINPENTPPVTLNGSNSSSRYFQDIDVLDRTPLCLLYLAGMYAILLILGILLCTEYIEPKIESKERKSVLLKTRIVESGRYVFQVGLKTKEIYLLAFCRFALLTVGGGLLAHWKGLSLRLNSDDQIISIIGGVNGLVSCIGRILAGILIDRFSFNRVMPVVGALLTIVLAITVPVSWISFPGFVALLWLAYFFAFMHFSTIPTQVLKLYDGKYCSSVLGVIGLTESLSYGTVLVLNKLVFNNTESYLPYYISMAVISLLTVGSTALVKNVSIQADNSSLSTGNTDNSSLSTGNTDNSFLSTGTTENTSSSKGNTDNS